MWIKSFAIRRLMAVAKLLPPRQIEVFERDEGRSGKARRLKPELTCCAHVLAHQGSDAGPRVAPVLFGSFLL